MGRRFTVVAVVSLLGTSAAWAQAPAPEGRSDSEYTETLYATDQHMAFSIRTTVIRWLGGVDVARERDSKASEKEGWWGDSVPQVSREMVRMQQSDR
jgi:SRSO17 transposase